MLSRRNTRLGLPQVQARALELLQQPDWYDFGPTFASEQLAKRDGIQLSDETVRRWMIDAGLWNSRVKCSGNRAKPDLQKSMRVKGLFGSL